MSCVGGTLLESGFCFVMLMGLKFGRWLLSVTKGQNEMELND